MNPDVDPPSPMSGPAGSGVGADRADTGAPVAGPATEPASDTGSLRHLTPRAAAALSLVCLLWGINVVMMKISTEGFPPALTAGLRNLVAAGIFVVVLVAMKQPVFHRDRRLLHGMAIGVLFAFDFFFMYTGVQYTNASRTIIFMYTHPIWVAVGAHFFFSYDRLTWKRILGLLLAMGGIASVFATRPEELPVNYWIGDIMIIVSALFWAATTVYIKAMSDRFQVTAVHILFYQLIFSVPLLLILAAIFERGFAINVTPVIAWSLVYQTIVVAAASYLVWYWMITRYHVTNLAVFSMLTPLFGVLAGVMIRGEALTTWLLVGLGLVLAGIYLVTAGRREAS